MRRPEQNLHLAVAQYLNLMLRPPAKAFWTSLDHAGGSKHTRLAGALRKARGVKAGLPDILIFSGDGRHPLDCIRTVQVAAIELKAAKGVQSPAQKLVAKQLEALGIHYAICRSLEDVGEVLVKLGLAF